MVVVIYILSGEVGVYCLLSVLVNTLPYWSINFSHSCGCVIVFYCDFNWHLLMWY